jgi:hypothetical protein
MAEVTKRVVFQAKEAALGVYKMIVEDSNGIIDKIIDPVFIKKDWITGAQRIYDVNGDVIDEAFIRRREGLIEVPGIEIISGFDPLEGEKSTDDAGSSLPLPPPTPPGPSSPVLQSIAITDDRSDDNSIPTDETVQFTAEGTYDDDPSTPRDITSQVTWKLSDDAAGTFDSFGKFTPSGTPTSNFTVRAELDRVSSLPIGPYTTVLPAGGSAGEE